MADQLAGRSLLHCLLRCFHAILLLTYARRQFVRARVANGIRDNDIRKALTALCTQRSSCASRQLQAWMSVRRFEIFHEPTALKSTASARCGDVLESL